MLVCEDCNQLRYIIDTIEFDDAGEYTCRANLTDGSMLGPESAGFLTVLGMCVCLFVCVCVCVRECESESVSVSVSVCV